MKKLALALMCLASVAFLASCDPVVDNPEPSIQIYAEDGYVQDGDVIDYVGDTIYVNFGFVMASNTQTNKKLASLVVTVDDAAWANKDLTGETAFTYKDQIAYAFTRDQIIGSSNISAVVTDEAGNSKTATIAISFNQPAQDLFVRTFEWYRLNNTITGLEEFGLEWKGNYPKDNYAKLIPMEGVKLFIFESNDWEEVKTDLDKAAFFSAAAETQTTAEEYWNVNVTQGDMVYDDVIGTIMPDGVCHLIHVTNSHSEYIAPQGTAVTINGEAK